MSQKRCQNQQFGRMNAHLPATLVRDFSNFPRTCPARHPLPSLLKVLHFLQQGQKVRNCDIILHVLPGLLRCVHCRFWVDPLPTSTDRFAKG